MPKYFFRMHDHDMAPDKGGHFLDLQDDEAAINEAAVTLVGIASDALPQDGHHREFEIQILRDGITVKNVVLKFDVEDAQPGQGR